MRTIVMLIAIVAINIYSDWNTFCGNSRRTSFVNTIGPESKNDILWEGSIDNEGGGHILISDNKLVTTRGDDIWYIDKPMVCHDLYTGELLWQLEFPGETRSPTMAIGFQNNVVYASNWQGGSGEDTLYAINAENGNIIWKNGIGVHGAPFLGCAFLDDGDFLLTLDGGRIARFNHETGDTLWSTANSTPSLPNNCQKSIGNNTAYAWTFEDAEAIVAIDLEGGERKYYINLPNTHPQTTLLAGSHPVIDDDGIIYVNRANNCLSAIKDDGEKMSIIWSDTIRGGDEIAPALGPNNTIYFINNYKLMRANALDGEITDSSFMIFTDTTRGIYSFLAVDQNETVFLGAGTPYNKLYSFNKSLELNWVDSIPLIGNGGPALSSSGLLAVAGKGDLLRVYKPKELDITNKNIKPQKFTISNRLNSLKYIFNLDKSLTVKLCIYNIRGQQVYFSNHNVNTAGFYEIEVKNLSRGQYISKVEIGNETFVKKVTVIQ